MLAIAWPMQPREAVFSSCHLTAKISMYASATPLVYAMAVLSRVCRPASGGGSFSISVFLQALFPSISVEEIDIFLSRDKRGLTPWMELTKRNGCTH